MKCDLCGEEKLDVIQVTDHTELFDGAYCPECLRGALPALSEVEGPTESVEPARMETGRLPEKTEKSKYPKTETCLFVGGCLDGEWHEVEISERNIRVPCGSGITEHCTVQSYRLEHFACEKGIWGLFILDQMSLPEATERILKNYRPVKTESEERRRG